MSRYQVTVNKSRNFNVTLSSQSSRVIYDVDDTGFQYLSGLDDVDKSNRAESTFLVWNELTQKHEYITAAEILDRVDGDADGALDFGGDDAGF